MNRRETELVPLRPPLLSEARAARERLSPYVLRSPLVRLNLDTPTEVFLKLENLQPIGSFKVRPAGNAILCADKAVTAKGVYTASSGNMAQGVASMARALELPCSVLLTETTAQTKIDALERMGATMQTLSLDEWWRVLDEHGHPSMAGLFVHPVAHQDVLAGDATVGLEILDAVPDVRTVLVPFGGGGLSSGIAAMLKESAPEARVIAVESDHCAPLTASRQAGSPVEIPVADSFVTGLGVGRVLHQMWPLVQELIADTVVVNAGQIAEAIRLLLERHRIVVEGAGASTVAAALSANVGDGPIVCVLSGGNLDERFLKEILAGRVPLA